ncbi:unnamed protein product [Prorocentrum cordatum]|uniref:Protein O-GlcNAc transferase n=1 Tax=Prorocentrum cordatum TaxID=2364126 RepID=A0ABN9RNG6_9DINO|nr:unnamed protein product [Polarella glacialis]
MAMARPRGRRPRRGSRWAAAALQAACSLAVLRALAASPPRERLGAFAGRAAPRGAAPATRCGAVPIQKELAMSRVHGEFPRAMVKSAHIDEDAVETACAALANSVLKGNTYQFEALAVVLRSMMPPTTGSQQVRGPPEFATIEKERLVWSEQDYMSGPQEQPHGPAGLRGGVRAARGLRQGGLQGPNGAGGGPGPRRGIPQELRRGQGGRTVRRDRAVLHGAGSAVGREVVDCATLRCKQARQPEAAVLLEEVAKRTPPHPATLNNLGTVYNMMRQPEKAEEYFKAAMEVAGHEEPVKDDLWNLGIAKKNMKRYDEALPMLLKALEGWEREEPEDDVTLAKLHDTVGSCYDLMGQPEKGVEHFSQARILFGRSIGADSPLYGSSCEGLTKSLIHAGRYAEGFDRLEETFLNVAEKDAIHPTPLFELLGYALEDLVYPGNLDPGELARLEAPIELAVRNMVHRGLDKDGNAGVLFERMGQAMLRCSVHQPASPREEQERLALEGALWRGSCSGGHCRWWRNVRGRGRRT